ncbi:C1 family peptidase [uncultured Desulfobulbus sp.]|uniref:C1 family peptidase n=1 Tax=uncultured Desulfobulbus sp. TaxID=239745 RepID=UPI0029C99722|nr:C1 family peptidase [uncultured Desulfobulbus sp.]
MPQNLKLLQVKLKNVNASWQAKTTKQSKLDLVQKKALLGVVPNNAFLNMASAQTETPRTFAITALPQNVDWRNHNGENKVTPVKDQGLCGSCVSFATTALIESMCLIERNISLDLSEADLHFCSSHGANCEGWFPSDALDSAKNRGVCEEIYFPYNSAFVSKSGDGWTAQCVANVARNSHVTKITSSDWYKKNSSKKKHLLNYGPLIACFKVYDDFFSYGGGVYHKVDGQYMGDHAVLVIGYSDIDTCWICKNSWGKSWGDSGYFKIKYGQCDIDSNPFHSAKGILLNLLNCHGSVDNNCTAKILAIDKGTLYWLDQNTTILNYGNVLSGTLRCTWGIDNNCSAKILAIDNSTFYWVDENSTILNYGNVINRQLSCTGSIDNNCTAKLLAVDNGMFYWVDENTTVLNHGKVVNGKLSCTGSIDNNCTAKLLAVDNGMFYWVDENTTVLNHGKVVNGKLSCTGSIDNNCTAKLLAVDNGMFYWVDENTTVLNQGDIR